MDIDCQLAVDSQAVPLVINRACPQSAYTHAHPAGQALPRRRMCTSRQCFCTRMQ